MALVGPTAVPDYTYKAIVLRWVDGDTVWLEVDLGFRIKLTSDFRLYGINTPEHNQAGFHEATAYAEAHAPEGSGIVIRSFKDPDKYGRWIVKIYVASAILVGVTYIPELNEALVASGLAVPYFGGTKAPVVTPN
jgi:micrococcal nuclease